LSTEALRAKVGLSATFESYGWQALSLTTFVGELGLASHVEHRWLFEHGWRPTPRELSSPPASNRRACVLPQIMKMQIADLGGADRLGPGLLGVPDLLTDGITEHKRGGLVGFACAGGLATQCPGAGATMMAVPHRTQAPRAERLRRRV